MYNLSKLYIERTRPTKPFPYLSFRLSAERSGEEPNKKLKRKWFWSGGRPKYEGDGAVLSSYAPRRAREKARESVPLPIGDFLQKKFGFRPKSQIGGESGIRTHDTVLPYTRFPGVRLRPLGHPSAEIV